MSEHITRKELKKDEIRETIVHGADALMSHKLLTTCLVVAAVVIAVAVFHSKTFYTEHQTVKAEAAYDDAKKAFFAPVTGSGNPAVPGEPSYLTDQAKYTDAAPRNSATSPRNLRTRVPASSPPITPR